MPASEPPVSDHVPVIRSAALPAPHDAVNHRSWHRPRLAPEIDNLDDDLDRLAARHKENHLLLVSWLHDPILVWKTTKTRKNLN